MNQFIFLVFFLIASFGCKKNNNSFNLKGPIERVESKMEVKNSSEREEVFFAKRKSELEINERTDEVLNLDQFIKDSSVRIVEARLENVGKDFKSMRCFDLSESIENKMTSNLSLNSNVLTLEIHLVKGKFSEQKVKCELIDKDDNVLKSKEFIFYQDLIIAGNVSAIETGLQDKNIPNKIDTFLLLGQGSLEIDNKSFLINAKKVISLNGAEVLSFKEKIAKNNQHGLDGGKISIFTEEAFGQINFRLHGQNGGEVTLVPSPPTHYPAHYNPDQLNGVIPQFGKVDSGLECKSNNESCKWRTVLSVTPTSGKPGYKGVQGVKGYKGFNGGNSGLAYFFVEKESNFQMEVESSPGISSKGGRGSSGGPGTPGGDVFCEGCADYCRNHNIVKGATGPMGDDGPLGDEGMNGIKFQSSFVNQMATRNNKVF